MKNIKKLLVLLLALLLMNSMIIPCFASVVPAATDAKLGETVTITLNYDDIAGIRGTLNISGDDIIDSIAVEVGDGFDGSYSETNRILAYFAGKPADFTCKLTVKLKDTAIAGNECKIDFEYETTVDGKMSSTPNYQYESMTIKIVVNYDELNRQIAIAESLHKDSYTEASWNVLVDALEKAIKARNSTSQAEVDAAAKALKDAIAALELKPGSVDYVELNRQIAIAQGLTKESYTEASWNVLADALAKAIEARQSTSQTEVDAAAKALKDAIAALEPAPGAVVNYDELNRQIAIAQDLTKEDYTEASWNVLADALEKAIEARQSTSQTEVDAAAKALKDAIAALELVPGAVVNYDELNRQIAIAQGLKKESYTEASWNVLADALEKAIKARQSTSQTEVDAAAKALNDAIDALEFKQGGSPENGDNSVVLPIVIVAVVSALVLVVFHKKRKAE